MLFVLHHSFFIKRRIIRQHEKQLNLKKGGGSFLMTTLLLGNQAIEQLTEPVISWPHCVQGAQPIYIICFLKTHHYSKSYQMLMWKWWRIRSGSYFQVCGHCRFITLVKILEAARVWPRKIYLYGRNRVKEPHCDIRKGKGKKRQKWHCYYETCLKNMAF